LNFNKLVNYIRKWHIQKADAEDLAQNIMLGLFKSKRDFDEIYFWNFIVRGKIYNFLRKRKKEKKGEERLINFLESSFELKNKGDLEYLLTQLRPSEQKFIKEVLKEGKISDGNRSMNWKYVQKTIQKCKEILKER
jgi:DNA-directed RNA polymerase specialized sigma24 family protein